MTGIDRLSSALEGRYRVERELGEGGPPGPRPAPARGERQSFVVVHGEYVAEDRIVVTVNALAR